jgi:hypothetical protein
MAKTDLIVDGNLSGVPPEQSIVFDERRRLFDERRGLLDQKLEGAPQP